VEPTSKMTQDNSERVAGKVLIIAILGYLLSSQFYAYCTLCRRPGLSGEEDDLATLYTIGHSNHSIEKFVGLLTANGITAVADVRSRPFSRRHPQFNKERLAAALAQRDIAYVFLGKELGARSEDPSCYENGKVQYRRLAATPAFKAGIERVLIGAEKFRLALICAEKEPLDCHRTLLVSRALGSTGASIAHILADGSMEPQEKTMARLIDLVGLPKADLFQGDDLIATACRLREDKIAYVKG
jgi:uncharacterized protein (DUF488 family)